MSIFNSIIEYIKDYKYNVGFVENGLQSIIDGDPINVNWLKHPYKNRWFADPFIFDVTDDEIIVLVEEWYDPIQRGRISKLIVDKSTYELKQLKVMIDEGFHLSFPAIVRKGDEIFIQPESSVNNQLVEYKYNKESDRFEKLSVISDLPLTDSVRTNFFGDDLLFSTRLPDANGKELGVYLWDESKKVFVPKEYCYFNDNISRMAGNFFMCNSKIYRPAQVCIKSYGDAVSIQEVRLDEGKFIFKEIRRIYSPNRAYDLGFHTFNEYNGMIVVDGLGFRRPKLAFALRKIKNILNH